MGHARPAILLSHPHPIGKGVISLTPHTPYDVGALAPVDGSITTSAGAPADEIEINLAKEESFKENGLCASLPAGETKLFSKLDIVGDPVIGLNKMLIEIRAGYKSELDHLLAIKVDGLD